MSLRSRRAAAPVSSSDSTTIFPLTMWRPPANRSIVDTSALRQQVLVMWVLAISAFTCAVIAMAPILPRTSTTSERGPATKSPDRSARRLRRLDGDRSASDELREPSRNPVVDGIDGVSTGSTNDRLDQRWVSTGSTSDRLDQRPGRPKKSEIGQDRGVRRGQLGGV